MPMITFNLLKELFEKQKGPVTTNEIINHVADKSPRNLENLVSNMIVLEKGGFVKKRFDRKKSSYVWELSDPKLNGTEILERYPELYEQTLYGEGSFSLKKRKR
ncbi:MAG: hypothetical protein GTN38_04710 [Candidatus Aenigmarchaeota archaeon]|nr:hypothetical protein [Candidatus Aenigmarchaeota archaeon]NIP41049.1 hypothetical protein [Candidatus Aenigmarchaeota archaeon]NIQ17451.1 hypothetical protein [Candidatus Aenigmarchaeota archaeon]NIS73645.1 hypothetical protein [Candidatus Aenigmarchaeota archaeon]